MCNISVYNVKFLNLLNFLFFFTCPMACTIYPFFSLRVSTQMWLFNHTCHMVTILILSYMKTIMTVIKNVDPNSDADWSNRHRSWWESVLHHVRLLKGLKGCSILFGPKKTYPAFSFDSHCRSRQVGWR